MVKSIIGLIVGYIVMFSLQVAAFITIYNVKGPDWAFKHASYQPSTQWTLTQFTVILFTAVIAGLVCALIAGRSRAPPWFWPDSCSFSACCSELLADRQDPLTRGRLGTFPVSRL